MTFEEWWKSTPLNDNGRRTGKGIAMRAGENRVPKGYVLVPVEPTEAMFKATYMLLAEEGSKVFIDDLYKAMIKAAQEAE